MLFPDTHWVRLSHTLTTSTPAYGGSSGLTIEQPRSMVRGDSCNAMNLTFSNHLGSHVDAPRHFVMDGKTVDSYTISDWIFCKSYVVDIPAAAGEILDIVHFEKVLIDCTDADLLLVRTGFEFVRGQKEYWSSSPAFSPELASYLKKRLPSLTAIGMDCISISSYLHRDLGRLAHKSFLADGLRIFEDLALAGSFNGQCFNQVIALPLIIESADAAPCTIIATLR